MTIRQPGSCTAVLRAFHPAFAAPHVHRPFLLTRHWSQQYATLPPQKHSASSAIAVKPALGLQKPADRVNPPASTLPPPLDVPERDPNVSLFSYLFKAGKAYLAFYKQGIKNIWGNQKLANEVRSRLGKEAQMLANQKRAASTGASPSSSEKAAIDKLSLLSRSDFQLLRRNRSAISRVPLFVVLFALLGEWLPLVAIYFTALMPYPCRIPAQIEKSRTGLETRRLESFRGRIGNYIPSSKNLDALLEKTKDHKDKLRALEQGQIFHLSRSLGLHARFWDRLNASGLMLPPAAYLKLKLKWHLAYLEQDDRLILKDGDVQMLKREEVALACEERGIDVLGKPDQVLRQDLRAWLEGSRKGQVQVLRMLLDRPSVWTNRPRKS